MSHITVVEVKVTNLAALEKATKKLCGTMVKNTNTFKWWGASIPGECDHKLQFKNCAYEIGVKKNKDNEYDLKFDSYHSGGLSQLLGNNLEKLMQSYSIENVKMLAAQNNYMVMEKQTENGVRLILTGE